MRYVSINYFLKLITFASLYCNHYLDSHHGRSPTLHRRESSFFSVHRTWQKYEDECICVLCRSGFSISGAMFPSFSAIRLTWQNQQNECTPSEDTDQPVRSPSLIRVFVVSSVRTKGFFMRTAETLIRLGGGPGWSESSLGAQPFCWFCHVVAHVYSNFQFLWINTEFLPFVSSPSFLTLHNVKSGSVKKYFKELLVNSHVTCFARMPQVCRL